VGIATTGFCHPGRILQLFHRQDEQILRLPTATARSHRLAGSAPFTVIGTNPADLTSSASFVIDKLIQSHLADQFSSASSDKSSTSDMYPGRFPPSASARVMKSTTSTPTSQVDPRAV
jgi:hypothetical protein